MLVADADFLSVTGQSIHERKSQSILAWKILEVKEAKHLDAILAYIKFLFRIRSEASYGRIC